IEGHDSFWRQFAPANWHVGASAERECECLDPGVEKPELQLPIDYEDQYLGIMDVGLQTDASWDWVTFQEFNINLLRIAPETTRSLADRPYAPWVTSLTGPASRSRSPSQVNGTSVLPPTGLAPP